MLRSREGNLLVASRNTSQVIEYDWETGAFIRIACEGGGLSAPSALLLERARNVLVASSGTSSVLRFASDGTYLGQFVSSGSGGLAGTGAMMWGAGYNLLVCSLKNHSILEFSGQDGSPVDHDLQHPGIQATHLFDPRLKDPSGLAFIYANECNHNGIPDSCDIASEASTDCNENEWPMSARATAIGTVCPIHATRMTTTTASSMTATAAASQGTSPARGASCKPAMTTARLPRTRIRRTPMATSEETPAM